MIAIFPGRERRRFDDDQVILRQGFVIEDGSLISRAEETMADVSRVRPARILEVGRDVVFSFSAG